MFTRGGIVAMLFTLFIGAAYAQPGEGPPLDMPTAEQVTSDYTSAVRQLEESDDPGIRIAAHHRLHHVFQKLRGLLSKSLPVFGGPEFVDPAAEALVRRRIPAHELADVDEAGERALKNCVAEVRRQHALGSYARYCLDQGHWLPWMFVPLPPAARANDVSESETAAWFKQRRKALRSQPHDRGLRIDVAAMLVATSDYSEAMRVLEPIRRDYAAQLLRGRALYASKQIDAALSELRAAIQQTPERPEARLTYARIVVQDRDDKEEEMAVAGEHYRAALCNLTRAEISPPPSLREELEYLEASLGEWIPQVDAWPHCDIRSASEIEGDEIETSEQRPKVVRRIEPLRAETPLPPAPSREPHGTGTACGHCAAIQSRNAPPTMSMLFLVLVFLLRRSPRVREFLRRRVFRTAMGPVALSLIAIACSGSCRPAPARTTTAQRAGVDDWAITQKRSTELHVTLRHNSLPAAKAPFLVDTSPYEAAGMNLRRYLTAHQTDSDGHWSDAHFVYHHAHIAIRPQLEHLDNLALSWRWPDRWIARISMAIDVDAYRIDYAVRRDGTPQFHLSAGPSESGTHFSASFAMLESGGRTPSDRWLGYNPVTRVDEQGGSAVMDVSIAHLFGSWDHEPEVLALRANDWIALRLTAYATAREDSVQTVRSTRPDDHRGNVRQGQHGDDSLFEPGTELSFERTVRVQVLESDLPRGEQR